MTTKRSDTELLVALIGVATDLSFLDPVGLHTDSAKAAHFTGELLVMLKHSIEIFDALAGRPHAAAHEPNPLRRLEPAPDAGGLALKVSLSRFQDVCSVSARELEQTLGDLTRAAEHEERCAAAESARRKLGRAIHSLLMLVRDTAVGGAAGVAG